MVDVRCKNCNKVLAKAVVFIGAIKCLRCKMIFEYQEYAQIYQTSTYTNNKLLQLHKDNVIKERETTESILPK